MAQNEVSTGIGLRMVRVALRDTDGAIKMAGSPAAGVAYDGLQIDGALALTLTVPEPQRVTARGDDLPYWTFQLAPTENPSAELRVSKTNLDVIAMVTATKAFGSTKARRIGLATDKQGNEDSLILWGSREAVDSEEGSSTFGQKCWQTYLLLSCEAAVRPASLEDAAVGEFVYSISTSPVTLDEFGVTFSSTVNGFTKTPVLLIVTKYKYWMDAFEGDGIETEFTLTQGAYLQTDSFIQVYVDGVIVAYTETDGVVTLDVPDDGAKVIIEYDYED